MSELKEYVEIKYFYSQEEKNNLAISLAEKTVEKSELEEEKKASGSQYKSKIDGLAANMNILSRQIKDGWEHRKIYARKRKSLLLGIWEWVDEETGEVIKTERLSGKDMQLSIEEQRAYEEQQRMQNEPIDDDSKGPYLLGSGDQPKDDSGVVEDIDHEDVNEEKPGEQPEEDPDPLDEEEPEQKPKRPRKPRKK
ncbi:hypothetical protein BWI93_01125 [Siphonobacter sp. BAB-5385]|uniref:hypothetical protein n=1 Tax=Siphonobacter sp. BAB-5385 TaxID=1864822 RepID=UPI000B9E5195|nr:hypothetical protein [Siphonobacter sp. BAB-5385]OZI09972.1 hypothetical protein BWI93_01125 [Siphonobacter sp. BAB-5385]